MRCHSCQSSPKVSVYSEGKPRLRASCKEEVQKTRKEHFCPEAPPPAEGRQTLGVRLSGNLEDCG